MGRLIIVGDIHGCAEEMVELIDRLEVGKGDEVIAVGDFVSKGPQVGEAIEYWKKRRFSAVLGNNEDRFLQMLADPTVPRREFRDSNRELLKRGDLVSWLAGLPLLIDRPEFGVTVVHAGLLPDQSPRAPRNRAEREACLRLRYLRPNGTGWKQVRKGEEKPGDSFWAERWNGRRTILYGHTPARDGVPIIAGKTIGLDTGCVYGGELTAAVFQEPGAEARFVSVAAKRRYATKS